MSMLNVLYTFFKKVIYTTINLANNIIFFFANVNLYFKTKFVIQVNYIKHKIYMTAIYVRCPKLRHLLVMKIEQNIC